MIKVFSKRYDKVWGYELWLFSPLKDHETPLENGDVPCNGPLIKIICSIQPLSIQVHPDDEMAQTVEMQEYGKSESWYILEHDNQAEIIVGLKTYDEYLIRRALVTNNFEHLLKKVRVKNGDFFNIPAGLVHGIGAGITLLEVQQPSDITYRYYDYNRTENGKHRELHIDKALRAQKDIPYALDPVCIDPLTYETVVGKQIFLHKPTTLDGDYVVINLTTYETNFAHEGETINFNNYVLVEIKK